MKSTPLVSVIIPSYNNAGFVSTAIESALAQTYPAVEIIVVDDGSTDDTRKVVGAFGDRVHFVHQSNKGLPGARNTGIGVASGDILAFLDADDEWSPNKLELQVALLLQDPAVVLVHSDVRFLEVATGRIFEQYRPRERFQGTCYHPLFFGNGVTPSTVIAWTRAVKEVGAFDASLTLGCEDYDLWLRLARHHKFAYTRETLTLYRLHTNNMTRNRLRMAQATLDVTRKALAADPQLRAQIGAVRADGHIAELLGSLATQQLLSGQAQHARTQVRAAMALQPRARRLWRLYALTLLPAAISRVLLA